MTCLSNSAIDVLPSTDEFDLDLEYDDNEDLDAIPALGPFVSNNVPPSNHLLASSDHGNFASR